jgi:cell division protein FtsA
MTKLNAPVIAGLDIGSTKVTVIIGTVNDQNSLQIVGVGTSPNPGMRQGMVVNIEATTEAIKKAREEAELMSGYKIQEVWLGVSGSHIQSFDSKGMVAIKNKEVATHDVERVIEAAKAVAVPNDRAVLHVIPREYKVDGHAGILDPIGMSGIRLEASVHIVTGSQTALANNSKCLEKAGLKSAGSVLEPLAAAMATLSEDEKALGVCVVDMGGGSCNLIYFVNGSVAHTSLIPVGGQHFSHDVAIGLRTPQSSAEELKKKYGAAMLSLIGEDESIEVEGVGGRKARSVLRRDLVEVLEPRADETLQLIYQDIRNSGLMPLMGSGVVLTGGASQLEGLLEMAEFVFDIPVRRGMPAKVGGLTEIVRAASFSTSVGLLLFGQSKKRYTEAVPVSVSTSVTGGSHSNAPRWTLKMKEFFDGLF